MKINKENSDFLKSIGTPIKEFFLANEDSLQNFPQAIQSLARYSPEQLGLLIANWRIDRSLDFFKQDNEKRVRTVDVFEATEPGYIKCMGEVFKLTLEIIAAGRKINVDTIESLARAAVTPHVQNEYEKSHRRNYRGEYTYAYAIALKSSTSVSPEPTTQLNDAHRIFLKKLKPILKSVECRIDTKYKILAERLETSSQQPNINFMIPIATELRTTSSCSDRLLGEETSQMVSLLLEEYEASIQQSETDEDKLHAILTLSAKIDVYHPLPDSNGRVSLAILDYLLIDQDFPPCVMYNSDGWPPVYLVTRGLSPLREGQRYFSNLMGAIENNREISPDFLPPTEQDSYDDFLDTAHFTNTVLRISAADEDARTKATTQVRNQVTKIPEEETREVASTGYEESTSPSPVINAASLFFATSVDQATAQVRNQVTKTPEEKTREVASTGYEESISPSPVINAASRFFATSVDQTSKQVAKTLEEETLEKARTFSQGNFRL